MKLVTSLERGSTGPLFFAPLADGLLIVVVFFLFGSQMTVPSGIPVELPTTQLRLAPLEEAHLLVLSAESAFNPANAAPVADSSDEDKESKSEEEPDRALPVTVIALNGRRLRLAELPEALDELRETKPDRAMVVLQADRLATHGMVVEVSSAVLEAGFELAYAAHRDN